MFTLKEKIFDFFVIIWNEKHSEFNPSRSDPGRREKINLNFYFHISLWFLKRFYKDLDGDKIIVKIRSVKSVKNCEN